MITRFAVVGHPNKGKSSIVATLAEDSEIAIAPTPGTTVSARSYPMRVDDETLYELIDTPGFQRPRQVLDWLEHNCHGADDRAAAVTRFVKEHRSDARFHDECELLQPLIEGAGILYVVDGSKPFGSEYEAEMQVLRWTGRPRMALINQIGADDHVDQWRRALDQYFALVRSFNPVQADVSRRFALLRSFAELNEEWQPALQRAIDALTIDRQHRLQLSARQIVGLICGALTTSFTETISDGDDASRAIDLLQQRLRAWLAGKEQDARREIESYYRHRGVNRKEALPEYLELDLFSNESAELFGLSQMQLLAMGVVSGAATGGGIDLATGGASLLMGTGIGALVGGVAALFGTERIGRLKLLGKSLMSRKITVGPVADPNVPWILLGRALLHHRLVSERNHARRDALIMEAGAERYLTESIDDALKRRLGLLFKAHRDEAVDSEPAEMIEVVEQLLVTHGGQ